MARLRLAAVLGATPVHRRRIGLSILLVSLLWISSAASEEGVRADGPLDEPDQLGPWAVGRTTFDVVDPARGGRTLPVDAWYPVDPRDATGPASVYDVIFTGLASEVALDGPPVSTQGPFPLVVFSHGGGGRRFASFFLCEHLASHGMVVVAPDHVGDTVIDSLFPGTPYEARDRPLDSSLVISHLLERNAEPTDPFFGRVDTERIGVTGYSSGAFTTLAVAAGFENVPPDARVRAIMPFAGGIFGGVDPKLVDVPALVLGGTADTRAPIDLHSVRIFDEVRAHPRYRVDILGAGHASFSNDCDFGEALLEVELPPVVRALALALRDRGCDPELLPFQEAFRITNLYAVAFFKVHVVGDPRYARFLTDGRVERDGLPVEFYAVPGGGNAGG